MSEQHRPGLLPQAKRIRAARQRHAARIRKAAILEVYGTPLASDQLFQLEIAVAFMDGKPTRSWVLVPQESSPPPGDDRDPIHSMDASAAVISYPHLSLFATEFAEAVRGYRVYSSDLEAERWAQVLFDEAGWPKLPFTVGNLTSLVRPLCALEAESRESRCIAQWHVGSSTGAAAAATFHATYIEALEIRVEVRRRETEDECGSE